MEQIRSQPKPNKRFPNKRATRSHLWGRLFGALLIAIAGTTMMTTQLSANPLSAVRWDKRPILVFSPNASDAAAREQVEALSAARMGLFERDQIVLLVAGDQVTVPVGTLARPPSAVALRAHFGVQNADFQVLLVGKDGGVKRRSRTVLSPQDLFCQIDQMPMRRQEMRASGQSSSC